MEEELKELTVKTLARTYYLRRVDGQGTSIKGILIRSDLQSVYTEIRNEDIVPLLTELAKFLLSASSVNQSTTYKSRQGNSLYHINSSFRGLQVKDSYGDRVNIYGADFKEIVDAIKILTGEKKWEKQQ